MIHIVVEYLKFLRFYFCISPVLFPYWASRYYAPLDVKQELSYAPFFIT